MTRRRSSPASPVDRRRNELIDQLEHIRSTMSADEGSASPHVEVLGPIIGRAADLELERLDRLDDEPDPWIVLDDVTRTARILAVETLAFFGGIAARELGLDRGACDRADALLTELSDAFGLGAEFVTLPAESEYVGVVADVVRVRFPGSGVWDLPVALHEFGHYVAPRLGEGEPVRSIIDEERDGRPYYCGSFAEELWCDVFATYVGGPAYGFSLAARLDAVRAHDDAMPTHPAPAKRVAAVLLTLDHLQERWQGKKRVSGSLADTRSGVARLWAERVGSARNKPGIGDDEWSIGDDEWSWAAGLVPRCLKVLDADDGCRARRYDDAARAFDVALALEDEQPVPAGAWSIADLMTGGWLARRAAEQRNLGFRVALIADHLVRACDNMLGVDTRGAWQ